MSPAPSPSPSPDPAPTRRPHVVVLGGGFGGLAAAERLGRLDVDVTIVDRDGLHVFQPLLYQVATGRLDQSLVASELRARVAADVTVRAATVETIDLTRRSVELSAGPPLRWDRLVVALGAGTDWLGVPGAAEHAVPLKDVRDATIALGQLAPLFTRPHRKVAVVIVGAGPTGVELAGALADLRAEQGQDRLRLSLVEAGHDLLSGYRPASRDAAIEALVERGVHVHTDEAVTAVAADHVELASGACLPAEVVLWATGVDATPVAAAVGLPAEGRRVPVGPTLRLRGHDDVFVVGDLAGARGADGGPLPQLAPVAQQAGRHAADEIGRSLRGDEPRPFHYRDRGTLAIIADRAAVADLPLGVTVHGLPAWALWLGVHAALLPDPLARIGVVANWATRTVRSLPGPLRADRLAEVSGLHDR